MPLLPVNWPFGHFLIFFKCTACIMDRHANPSLFSLRYNGVLSGRLTSLVSLDLNYVLKFLLE